MEMYRTTIIHLLYTTPRTTTENTLWFHFVYIFSILHSVQSYENKIVLSCLLITKTRKPFVAWLQLQASVILYYMVLVHDIVYSI